MRQASYPLTRQQISEFVGSDRGIRAFEALQTDNGATIDALNAAAVVTLGANTDLPGSRALALVAGNLTGTDGGAGSTYTLGLADTAVTPGPYGNGTGLCTVTVDQKGRITEATSYTVGAGLQFASGALRAKAAGTYGTPTGTLTRTTFSAGISTGASAAYVQAEANAMLARIAGLEQRLAALITDLQVNGNLS